MRDTVTALSALALAGLLLLWPTLAALAAHAASEMVTETTGWQVPIAVAALLGATLFAYATWPVRRPAARSGYRRR